MSIAENRRARFDYHVEERFEAGIVLEGWEVKAVRAGQVQLTDGYVVIRDADGHVITSSGRPWPSYQEAYSDFLRHAIFRSAKPVTYLP